MYKVLIIFLSVVLAISLSFIGLTPVDKSEDKPQSVFILPLSLKSIEEEAFSDTAATVIVLPDGFLKIGEKAFDKAWNLKAVYIPNTTEYVADSAFAINSNLTIHGIDDSYAKDWAYSHGIPFVVDNVWNAIAQSGRTHNTRTDPVQRIIAALVFLIFFELFRLSCYEKRSRRSQDRPELNPIDYNFP